MSEASVSANAAKVNAMIATSAGANAAAILSGFGTYIGQHDMLSLMEMVDALVKDVKQGDMSVVEQMLLSQAVALQGMFTNLALRAANQTDSRQLQTQLGLALRAQAQSRTTLEALTALKNPSAATFIRQANIAGQQQVNNGVVAGNGFAYPRSVVYKNELLEACDGKRVDYGATHSTSRTDKGMAAMGKVDRA